MIVFAIVHFSHLKRVSCTLFRLGGGGGVHDVSIDCFKIFLNDLVHLVLFKKHMMWALKLLCQTVCSRIQQLSDNQNCKLLTITYKTIEQPSSARILLIRATS